MRIWDTDSTGDCAVSMGISSSGLGQEFSAWVDILSAPTQFRQGSLG